VVECGTWKGASAANLSLVCRIVGRQLHIYDSFQGLPAPQEGDREVQYYMAGDYCGTLDEVKRNISRAGAIDCCEFIQGWFHETLPQKQESVTLAYLDVDYEASLGAHSTTPSTHSKTGRAGYPPTIGARSIPKSLISGR
jgi:O-methyltransferase